MSKVAQAKQEVSESPSKNAVNVPQNRKLVEKTVNQKLKVYGVIQAFKNGRFPDNKQIDEALVYAEKNSPVDLSKLSPDGKKLIKDLREIIAIMRQMVREKNSHEEFQNFLFHSMKADVSGNAGVNVPVSKDEAQKDKETAGEALRTLGTLFLKNGEARKLISDLGLVGRDMFADSAQFAAQKIRPDEEKLQNVDEPAPENQFHDDTPDYLKQAQQKKDEVTQIAKEHANEVQNAGDPNASADHNAEVAANQAGAAKERVKQVIPDKHKEIAKEHKEKTKNYLKENFPEERRDQFIYRLKKVLVECQRHKDYQDAMDFFLTAFENYKGHANHIHTQVEESAQNLKEEGHVDTAQSTFRTLIERFANGQSTQPIVDSLDTIYNDCLKDPELKSWFKKLDTYIRRCLQEPGFVMKDEANSQAKQLQEGGRKFFTGRTREIEGGRTIEEKGKYQPHFEQLFDNIATFFKAMGDDPLNKKFGQKWHKFGRDIFFNSEGNVTFKPQLWDDIRNPILPGLLAHVGFIPIARIEFKDPTIELVIENLNVDPANIIPNLIEIDAHTHHKMSAFNKIGDKHKGTIKVMLSQIQTDLRDVAWSINKKKGFPSLKDSGLADVFLGGNGLTVAITLETETNNVNVFKVKEVKAKIHKIDFAIRNSKHDLLVKILRPLATTLIKGAICKAAESGIRDALEKLNENLTAAKEAEQGQKMDVLKSRFAKKDTGPSQSEFKVPTSKRDSILPQMGDPNGWVKRIDKMDDLAASTGPNHKPDWHSPAFSIVPNASGKTPAQPNVSSKPNGI